MARDYAAGMPVGTNSMPVSQNTPAPYKAIAQYYGANGSTSSLIGLTEDTTAIEITTGTNASLLRWVYVSDGTGAQTSVTSANYDHVIPANSNRRFAVPQEVINNAQGYSSMVGANIANGLFRRIAVKTEGIGSVFTSEYGSSNSY